jgi:hypothetical protein
MERITNAEVIRSVRISNAPTMMIGEEELEHRAVELLESRQDDRIGVGLSRVRQRAIFLIYR